MVSKSYICMVDSLVPARSPDSSKAQEKESSLPPSGTPPLAHDDIARSGGFFCWGSRSKTITNHNPNTRSGFEAQGLLPPSSACAN